MDVVAALVPSLAVALLFWFVVRAMLHGDRRERAALARLEREEAERAARSRRDADGARDLPAGPGGGTAGTVPSSAREDAGPDSAR